MRFPYTRYQAEPAAFDPARQIIELPHIPITLVAATGKAVRILALVDSGADVSFFGPIHARFLGLEIEAGIRESCTGIGGISDCYYHTDISIDVGDHRLQIGAHFSNLWSNDFAILGRKDFFEYFNILFDETKKVIELTPSR